MARRAEDREGGHVGAEQRQHEHERADRTAREEELLGAAGLALAAEREDPDVDDQDEVAEDDQRRNHRRALPGEDAAAETAGGVFRPLVPDPLPGPLLTPTASVSSSSR